MENTLSRTAAEITIDRIDSYDELQSPNLESSDATFASATREHWDSFAVSGVMQFDKTVGHPVMQDKTDLDGQTGLELLKLAGIDTSNPKFVKPGTFSEGDINLDTGDRSGVELDAETGTAFIDHHAKGGPVTSTAEITYSMLTDLGLLQKSPELDRLVEFVTKVDNRQFPAEEFLRSAKTLLGLQRSVGFSELQSYFQNHESASVELQPEEWAEFGLEKAAHNQQKTVDTNMLILARMESERKTVESAYGSLIVNENNELPVGSSAAYVRHDGIINLSPGKSFAVTLNGGQIDEAALRASLGENFQGKIIRGSMWIYNDSEPLLLTKEDIVAALQ